MPATFQRARSWWDVTTSTMRNPESWKLSWSVNQVFIFTFISLWKSLFVCSWSVNQVFIFISLSPFHFRFILLLWFFKSPFVFSRFGTLYLQKLFWLLLGYSCFWLIHIYLILLFFWILIIENAAGQSIKFLSLFIFYFSVSLFVAK